MPDARRVPAASNLFREDADGARLLGSRCASCATPYFPKSEMCHNPSCDHTQMQDAAFGPRGRLWTCAIQNYPPPAPALYEKPYRPYALGVVDLPEGLRVVGRVAAEDPESVKIGCDVELVVAPLTRDEDGNEIVTWMFKPL
jgi:uncharacterized OB-fold protein